MATVTTVSSFTDAIGLLHWLYFVHNFFSYVVIAGGVVAKRSCHPFWILACQEMFLSRRFLWECKILGWKCHHFGEFRGRIEILNIHTFSVRKLQLFAHSLLIFLKLKCCWLEMLLITNFKENAALQWLLMISVIPYFYQVVYGEVVCSIMKKCAGHFPVKAVPELVCLYWLFLRLPSDMICCVLVNWQMNINRFKTYWKQISGTINWSSCLLVLFSVFMYWNTTNIAVICVLFLFLSWAHTNT